LLQNPPKKRADPIQLLALFCPGLVSTDLT
jgi:hypothetical protein